MLVPTSPGEVTLRDVKRRFGDREILRGIDIHIRAGSIIEIQGDNGAGKSSLLRIIAGTLAADSGEVVVAGAGPGRGKAALVPAGDRALYWRLSGRQELEFFAGLAGVPAADAQRLATQVAALVEGEYLLDRQIGTLSTGQRRRMMVARSLVGAAPVLLMDEPYADLDRRATEAVAAVARHWTSHGGSVIWTSPVTGGGPEPDDRHMLVDGTLRSG
jgi:ABC-2 type transport system ATP-binding protein